MGELTEYFKQKYSKNDSKSDDQLIRTSVKNKISDLCEEYLKDAEDTFEFEVLQKELPYAVSVIYEEPLKTKYEINQIDKSLFVAKLREIEL